MENKNSDFYKNLSSIIYQPIEKSYKIYITYTVLAAVVTGVSYGLGILASITIEVKKEILIGSLTAAVGMYFVLLWLYIDSRRKYSQRLADIRTEVEILVDENNNMKEKLKLYGTMEIRFAALASENKACDRKLFDLLYSDFGPNSNHALERMNRIIELIDQNISILLEEMRGVYLRLCGVECGITIKHIVTMLGQSPEDWKIKTVVRDRRSSIRGKVSEDTTTRNTVGQNTDTEYLFVRNEGGLFCLR